MAVTEPARERRVQIAGLGYGVTVHVLWGLAPLYWKLLRTIAAPEVVAHRIVWGMVTFCVLIAVSRRFGDLRRALRQPAVLRAMLASGALVATNWLAFIYAVETDRVLHASLGYFINPLVAVLLGRVFLGERLGRLELVALALAAAGVVQYALLAGSLPWISLVVASSFGLYGLVRKTAPVDALIGSTLETALLVPVCVAFLAQRLVAGQGTFGHGDTSLQLLLVASGPVTAIPTLWFIHAARRLPLWTMGFLQYLTPTGQFLLAVAVWHEPFTSLHLSSFACIWAGLIVFSAGMWNRLRTPTHHGR